MKRLSDLDTLFLTLDNERYPLHGGGLLVFDPSTSPEPWTLAHVRDHLIRLLPVMPPLRRRLVEVPFGLAAPVWVEDPEFNIDDHLHTLGIPAPGGDRELAAVADEIGSLPESLQPMLLRALESGEIQPVGEAPRKVDARLLTATDADVLTVRSPVPAPTPRA